MQVTTGRRVDIDIAAGLKHAAHFEKGHPEHRVVFESRTRHHQPKCAAFERQTRGAVGNDIDTFAGRKIDTDVMAGGRPEIAHRAVDVHGPDLQDRIACSGIDPKENPR